MPTKQQKISHCHKRIAKVAKELAGASYEELMSHDVLYKMWKKKNPGLEGKRLQLKFINDKWGLYVPAARATLTLLLREPIDERVKEEIMQILVLDSTLVRGRVSPAVIAGTVQQKN